MSTIALASPFAALNPRNIGSVDRVFLGQLPVRSIRSSNCSDLLVGKLGVPVLKSERKSVLLGGVFQVNLIGSCKKMLRIKALWVIALVANKNVPRNLFAMCQNIHKAMGSPSLAFVHNKAIAFRLVRSLPLPTAIRRYFAASKQPFHNWFKAWLMALLNSLSPIRHVVVAAHAATNDWSLTANLACIHATSPYVMGVSSIYMCHTQGR